MYYLSRALLYATQRVVSRFIFASVVRHAREEMLRNHRIREQVRLPNYCYADGRRSSTSQENHIDTHLDSGIRAVVIDLDISYAAAREFIELEIPSAQLKDTGVPSAWMIKYFEYAGYVKAPQPTTALSLAQVLAMLSTSHRVMLEVDDSMYVPLVDGVLYDVEDWRGDIQRVITGYWVFRQRRSVWPGTLKGRVVDASGCTVQEFEDSDVLVRDPAELAGYAFHTRRFENAWELDKAGDNTFEATFAATLQHSQDALLVQSQSLRCSPKYLHALANASKPELDSADGIQDIASRAMNDARRLLDACDVEYELKGNGTLRLGNALGYRPRTGEVFVARERRVRASRGFKALLRTL